MFKQWWRRAGDPVGFGPNYVPLGSMKRRDDPGHSLTLPDILTRPLGFYMNGNARPNDPAETVDPWRFAAGFSSINEEDHDRLQNVMETYLTDHEIDLLHLYVNLGLSQSAIGFLFGLSQPTVRWQMGRAVWRIKEELGLIRIEDEEIRALTLEAYRHSGMGINAGRPPLTPEKVADLIVSVWHTRNGVKTAALFGTVQSRVSMWLVRMRYRLQQLDNPRAQKLGRDLVRIPYLKRLDTAQSKFGYRRAVLDLSAYDGNKSWKDKMAAAAYRKRMRESR